MMSEHLTQPIEEYDMSNADEKGEESYTHRDLDEESITSPALINEEKHQADSSPEYVSPVPPCRNIPQSPLESPFMIGQIWKTYCNTLQSPSSLQHSRSLQTELMSVGYESIIPSVRDDAIKEELIDYSSHTSHLNESNTNIETHCSNNYNPSMAPYETNNSQSTENELHNKTEIESADKILSGNGVLENLNIISKGNEKHEKYETKPLTYNYQEQTEEICQLREDNTALDDKELQECIVDLKATGAAQHQSILDENSDLPKSVGVKLNPIIHSAKISNKSIENLKVNKSLENNFKSDTPKDYIEEPKLKEDENIINSGAIEHTEFVSSVRKQTYLDKEIKSNTSFVDCKLDENIFETCRSKESIGVNKVDYEVTFSEGGRILPLKQQEVNTNTCNIELNDNSFVGYISLPNVESKELDEIRNTSEEVETSLNLNDFYKESNATNKTEELFEENKNLFEIMVLFEQSLEHTSIIKADDATSFHQHKSVGNKIKSDAIEETEFDLNLHNRESSGKQIKSDTLFVDCKLNGNTIETYQSKESIGVNKVDYEDTFLERERYMLLNQQEVNKSTCNIDLDDNSFVGDIALPNAEDKELGEILNTSKEVETSLNLNDFYKKSNATNKTEELFEENKNLFETIVLFEQSLEHTSITKADDATSFHQHKSVGNKIKSDAIEETEFDLNLHNRESSGKQIKSDTLFVDCKLNGNTIETYQSKESIGVNKVDYEDTFLERGRIMLLKQQEVNKSTCNIDLDDDSFVGDISYPNVKNKELDEIQNISKEVEKSLNQNECDKKSNVTNTTGEQFDKNKNISESLTLIQQSLGHSSIINAIEETESDSSLLERKSVENIINSGAIEDTGFVSSLCKNKSLIKSNASFVDECKLDENTIETCQTKESIEVNIVDYEDTFSERGRYMLLNQQEVNKSTCNIDLDDNSFVGDISHPNVENKELDEIRNTSEEVEQSLNLNEFEMESNATCTTGELFDKNKNLSETMPLFEQVLGQTPIINAIEETESDSSLLECKSVENIINSDPIKETEFDSALRKHKSPDTEIKYDTSFVDCKLAENTIETCQTKESNELNILDYEYTFSEGGFIMPLKQQEVNKNTCNIDLDYNSFVGDISHPNVENKELDEIRNTSEEVEQSLNLNEFEMESNATCTTGELFDKNKNLSETMPLFEQVLGQTPIINAIEETESDSSLLECKSVENIINSDPIKETEFDSALRKQKSSDTEIKSDTSFVDCKLDETTIETCQTKESIEVNILDYEYTFSVGGFIMPLKQQEVNKNTCNIDLDDNSFVGDIALPNVENKELDEKEIVSQEFHEKQIKSDISLVDCKLDRKTIQILLPDDSFKVNKVDENVFKADEASLIILYNSELQNDLIKPGSSFTMLKGNQTYTHSVTEEQASFIDVNKSDNNSCKIKYFFNVPSLQNKMDPIAEQTTSIPNEDNTLDENTNLGVNICLNRSSEESSRLKEPIEGKKDKVGVSLKNSLSLKSSPEKNQHCSQVIEADNFACTDMSLSNTNVNAVIIDDSSLGSSNHITSQITQFESMSITQDFSLSNSTVKDLVILDEKYCDISDKFASDEVVINVNDVKKDDEKISAAPDNEQYSGYLISSQAMWDCSTPNTDNTRLNVSHEIMQKSMSDHVTSQSLKLSIPQEETILKEYCVDEELRLQCELQTENVLLMKWPTEFHNKLSVLKEQNNILSDKLKSISKNEIHLLSLRKENDELHMKLETISKRSEDVDKENISLLQKIKLLNEDQRFISDLKAENVQLLNHLERYSELENNLTKFKAENKYLLETIKSITAEKGMEIPLLTSTPEKEGNLISSENENGKFLNSEKKIQQSSSVIEIGLQLEKLIQEKSDLEKYVQDLKTRLDESNTLNEEKQINFIKCKEKTIKSEELTRSLEDEVLNLKTQNELLWNELKRSTKNEEGLYVIEEEKLVLEKRMSQMKKQLQELDEIKLVNEKLKCDLVSKGTDIYKLSDDKKKLKSSLIKANAKLIELDNENECLSELVTDLNSKIDELESQTKIATSSVKNVKEEKQALKDKIEEFIKKEEEHTRLVESEQIHLQTNLCSLSEYINGLISENNFIREQLVLHEIQIQSCEEENRALRVKLKTENKLTENISTQNNQLKSQIFQLQENTDQLMKDLEMYTNMCFDLDDVKEQNTQLNIKINFLLETVRGNEETDFAVMLALSSLSESVSSYWEDNVLLKEQVIICNEDRDKLTSKYSSEKNELLEQLLILQNNFSIIQQKNSYLTAELNGAEYNENFIRELESHISSLGEVLMSEIAKYDSLSLINAEIEDQLKSILVKQHSSEKELSDQGKQICDLENKLKKSKGELELKNIEIIKAEENLTLVEGEKDILATKVNNLESLLAVVQELQDKIAFLNNEVNCKNIELNDVKTQLMELEVLKMEAENKTKIVNQLLNKQELIVNELNLRLTQDHELLAQTDLELQSKNKEITQITELLDSKTKEHNDVVNVLDELQNYCKEVDINAKENLDLRKIMVQEISSLSGNVETSNYDTYPITSVFQELMREFLGKEKEVILGLQNDYETKIKETSDEIDKLKTNLITKQNYLEERDKEMMECRKQFDEQIITISNFEKSNKIIISELKRKEHDINELQKELSHTSIEKDALIQSNDLRSNNILELEQKVHQLESDLVVKDGKILSLNGEIKQLMQSISELETQSEIEHHTLNQNKNIIELTTEISELKLKLPQLEHELSLKISEVLCLKNELEHLRCSQSDLIKQCSEQKNDIENLTDELHHHKNMLGDFNIDLQIKNTELLEVKRSAEIIGQENEELKFRIEKLNLVMDECCTLETQIKSLNEELMAKKLLYEEDLFIYKEEITAKTTVIKDLHAIIGKQQPKTATSIDPDNSKKDQETILKLQEELQKLKKESATLSEGYNKFNIINRNLSLEIEQLSIALKHEKETNADLTAKSNSAKNHIAEYEKQNYCLKDKIDELESKIQNQCLLSSRKIVFPYGIDTIDKQLAFINDKFAEFDKLKSKMDNVSQEYKTISIYVKSQEEKMSTILKRELNLKKSIASSDQQTFGQNKVLEQLESELLPLFNGKISSLLDIPAKIRALMEENELLSCNQPEDIKELGRKLDEAIQENQGLDSECEMMHKHIKEQEEMIATVLKREEDLKKINMELASHIANRPERHTETNSSVLINDLERLYELFPDKPSTFNKVLNLIKNTQAEVESLKNQISESKDEYRNLDKECEDMFNQYQEKEKELAEVLRREAKFASETKTINENLKERIQLLSTELDGYKSRTKSALSSQAECQCTELKSRLSELRLDLADKNAKITALVLQLEANSFPMKKKVTDLEKSLDQAKIKISELKAEVRRNQHQMEEVTVALRADCERCRVQPPTGAHHDSGVQTSPSHTADELAKKAAENNKLKALCKSRNIRIAQLEQALGEKLPRTQRTPLKEMKDNFNTSSS